MEAIQELITQVLEQIRDSLENDIVAGGLVLGSLGTAVAMLRNTPKRIWAFLRTRLVLSVEVVSEDIAFEWIVAWLDEQPYSKRTKRVFLSSRPADGEDDYGGERVPNLTPAPGVHLFWYSSRPVWLTRERHEPAKDDDHSGKRKETLRIYTLGRNQEPVRALVNEARAIYYQRRKKSGVPVYIAGLGRWFEMKLIQPRPLSSVVLPDGVMESILADAQKFMEAAEWYRNRGIPWRRGYLFYGPPGTGKTSFISALSGRLGLSLYVVNAASPGLTDESLIMLLSQVGPGSALLFEDIDTCLEGRDVKQNGDSGGLTFSGLLNALDGVASAEGVITFITTNHIEKLDRALIRPGRVDMIFEFGPATRDQARRMFELFFPGHPLAEVFAKKAEGMAPAKIQRALILSPEDPNKALEALDLTEGQSYRFPQPVALGVE